MAFSSILIAILGLSVVVIAHEFGHYLGARLAGMRVKQFALGYGWRLFGLQGRETDFRINAIPFGGYVMVDGYEQEKGSGRTDPRMMQNRPPWARALYSAAGPFFSIIFAILVVGGVAVYAGLPTGSLEVMIGEVQPGSPAAASHLQAGDRIVAVNGVPTASYAAMVQNISAAGDGVTLTILRRGQKMSVFARPSADHKLGISVMERRQYSHDGASPAAVLASTWRMVSLTGQTIGQLFSGRASLGSLSGPLALGDQLSKTVKYYGWADFLIMLAFLSVNLGLLNLLPIPALDGGRLLLIGLEKLGLKLSETRQAVILLAGFALLFVLLVFVSIKDLLHLLS